MSKYWSVIRLSFSEYITYRLQVIFNILGGFITPAIMVFSLSLTQNLTSVAISSLISYYLVIALAFPFVVSNVDVEMDQLTEKGDVYKFLVKPFSLYRWLICKHFSEKIIPLFFVLPIILLITYIVDIYYSWSILQILNLLLVILLGFILSFNLSYLVGLFCFWIDEFWPINNLKFVLFSFLSGSILPYSLFPEWLSKFLTYTPFPYLSTWIYRTLNFQSSPLDYGLSLFWIIISGLIVKLLERQAIAHFSYVGS